MDTTGEIKLTTEVAGKNGFEFLDLKLEIVEGLIRVTNSFSYTSPDIQYPKSNICNITKGIILRLRRICDDDETYDKRSTEYQNYLIARERKSSVVKQQFSEVRKKTRTEATQNRKEKVTDIKFITTYNQALPNINKIIKSNLFILHTDQKMKKIFPPNTMKTLYRREKNIKEILSSSLFPSKAKQIENSITSSNKCDICKNFLLSDTKFKCTSSQKYVVTNFPHAFFECIYFSRKKSRYQVRQNF